MTATDNAPLVLTRRVAGARHHKDPWTGPEIALAARDDLAIAEIAKMTGRTYHAVRSMRKKLNREDPRVARLANLPTTEEAQP